ncbi:acyltransferase [Kitasatospora purpeofusca]|uniref:acyltransferase family protein n=1 Tax=Kitasatospora purpeofusca TaxID=67352 RepID=UPI0033FC2DD5
MPSKYVLKAALLTARPLSEALGRENGFGFLRLLFALSVIFAHANPLGMGTSDLGTNWSHGQAGLGAVAVAGFFVLSGLLITRSGMRLSTARFLWNRAIRILPGFWACLLLTAFVIAPTVARHEHLLNGFWSHPQGPWEYIRANWSIGVNQWSISDLLAHNPHAGSFNGSIWSLAYETLCYIVVAALAATGLLRRARWAVLGTVAVLYGYTVHLALDYPHLRAPGYTPTGLPGWRLPLLGTINMDMLIPLGLMFGLGAIAELYKTHIRMNGIAALVAFGIFMGATRFGGYVVIGIPALAYLLLWIAAFTPRPLTRIGTKVDLSYGVYIYAFPIQQTLTLWHVPAHGYAVYTGTSVVLSILAAFLSWHIVEKPALELKNIGTSKTHRRPSVPHQLPGTTASTPRAAFEKSSRTEANRPEPADRW